MVDGTSKHKHEKLLEDPRQIGTLLSRILGMAVALFVPVVSLTFYPFFIFPHFSNGILSGSLSPAGLRSAGP